MKAFFSNHLVNEKSPYLLQHARDPIDWYPWDEKAFSLAKKQDKPIFLSIGYATCHWCHVMERESFQNIKVAEALNKIFVCIKVDREEHPEVDALYMDFAQALLSSGVGWPLNLFLTPELKPFYAATYLPAENKRGMTGLIPLCEHIGELWKGEKRSQIFEQAEHIVKVFQEAYHVEEGEFPKEEILHETIRTLLANADFYYGGIKGSPKFPMSYLEDFLFRYGYLYDEKKSLEWAKISLEMMKRGGLYDHLGGGFSRYSVDGKWLIPHFEKMLYDQALLVSSYLEGCLKTSNEDFKEIAKETLEYVLREITSEEGGFYSAQDADTEGNEGLYYSWAVEEIETILDPEERNLFLDYYNLTKEGNFDGRNVLYVSETLDELAQKHQKEKAYVQVVLSRAKHKLFLVRASREPLLKDDKILTSWNGLMIDAMTKASRVLKNKEYLKAAILAAECIRKHLMHGMKLLRSYRQQEARHEGQFEDYVFLVKGLLSLFEVTLQEDYLRWAQDLVDEIERLFKREEGAYFQAGASPWLVLRKCDFGDDALPSANAVHAENLQRLYELTYDETYLLRAEEILKVGYQQLEDFPLSSIYQAIAITRYYDKKKTLIVVALDEAESLKNEILDLILSHYHPHWTLLFKPFDSVSSLEILKDKQVIDGQTAIYVCQGHVCKAPMIQLEDLKQFIAEN